jgi:hypothetical protein
MQKRRIAPSEVLGVGEGAHRVDAVLHEPRRARAALLRADGEAAQAGDVLDAADRLVEEDARLDAGVGLRVLVQRHARLGVAQRLDHVGAAAQHALLRFAPGGAFDAHRHAAARRPQRPLVGHDALQAAVCGAEQIRRVIVVGDDDDLLRRDARGRRRPGQQAGTKDR